MEFPHIIRRNLTTFSTVILPTIKNGKSAMQCSYPDRINVMMQKMVITVLLHFTATNIKTPHNNPQTNSLPYECENLAIDRSITFCCISLSCVQNQRKKTELPTKLRSSISM
jgi:hypothetical protein